MRTTLNRILLRLILLFPLTTLIQGLPHMDAVNRVMMVFIIGLLVLSVFVDKISLGQLLLLSLALFLTVWMVVFSVYFTSVNFYVYFPFWCLYFVYLKRHFEGVKAFVRGQLGFMHFICALVNLLLLASHFYPGSYQQTSGWGDAVYFASFTGSEHRLATVCVFVITLTWLLAAHRKKYRYYLYALIPLADIFICGARTYLFTAALLLGCIVYSHFKNKRLFYALLPLMGILLAAIVLNTPAGAKLLHTFSGKGYGGYWFVFTNSRNVIWAMDLKEFLGFPLIKKLFGAGEGIPNLIHVRAGLPPIWAHNDFIQVLLVNGVAGLALYAASILSFAIPLVRRQRRGREAPLPMVLAVYLLWLFSAIFNGFYTYTCAMLTTPFFAYAALHGKEIAAWDPAEGPPAPAPTGGISRGGAAVRKSASCACRQTAAPARHRPGGSPTP